MAKKTSLGTAQDIKYIGSEPTYGNNVLTDKEIAAAYNWYNYVCDHNQAKEFTIIYFKANKAGKGLTDAMARLPDYKFVTTLGWICRMLQQGAKLPERTMEFMKEKAKVISAQALALKQEKEQEEKKEEKPTVSIQQRIAEQVNNLIGDIEVEVDVWPDTKFKASEYLRKRQVKAPQANAIAEYYDKLNDEVLEAISGSDKELTQAYTRSMSKTKLKKFQEFIQSIVTDCKQVAANAKASRKPRAKKAKSAVQVAAKMKYLQRDEKLNITSVSPAAIIRAQQVWIYNVKTRKLGQYVAASAGGLNIKGTTILDFDEKNSIQKKLRKPEQVLPGVTQGGKIALRRIMENINAKPAPLNGRINGDTLILKVVT